MNVASVGRQRIAPSRRLSGGRPFDKLRAGSRLPRRERDALGTAGKMPAPRKANAACFGW